MTIKFSEVGTLKEPTYSLDEIMELKKKGATSLQLIQLHLNEGKTFFGIVGVKHGKRMDSPNDLIALPCLPFCPDGTPNLSTQLKMVKPS